MHRSEMLGYVRFLSNRIASAKQCMRNIVCFSWHMNVRQQWIALQRRSLSKWQYRLTAAVGVPSTTLLSIGFLESLIIDLEYHVDSLAKKVNLREETPEKQESDLIVSIKRGVLAMWRQEFQKAEKILHVTLKMAQDLANRDAETYILDLLANVYYSLGQVKRAEDLFREVMKREVAKGKAENDLGMIDMSLKMAELYAAKREDGICQDGLDFCLRQIKQRLQQQQLLPLPADAAETSISSVAVVAADKPSDVARMYFKVIDTYANFYLSRGAERQCLKLYSTALSTCQQYADVLKPSAEYPHLLNNAASVLMRQGELTDAHQLLEEAVRITEQTAPEDYRDSRRAAYLINLGQVYLRQKNFILALELCQKGAREARASDDEETEKEADECINWAKQYKVFSL